MTQSKLETVFGALPTADEIAAADAEGREIGTSAQMATIIDISQARIRRHLTRLRVAKSAHIHRWTDTVPPRPVWVLGDGPDAPPPTFTPEQRAERQRISLAKSRERMRQLRAGLATPQDGAALAQTLSTIERVIAQPPRPWFAALQDVAGSDTGSK